MQPATSLAWGIAVRNSGAVPYPAPAGWYDGTAEEIDGAPKQLPQTTS